MPYITLPDHLPGITGLLEYRQDTGKTIRELTQILMRGPSTLTEAERELIASVVSTGNACKFCSTAHIATANLLLGEEETIKKVREDLNTAPVSEKMKVLLTIAAQVQQGGKHVTADTIRQAKEAGAADLEIHDTVLIAALFSMYNRYVDGLETVAPDDSSFYKGLAERLVKHGYNRLPDGYDHLKK